MVAGCEVACYCDQGELKVMVPCRHHWGKHAVCVCLHTQREICNDTPADSTFTAGAFTHKDRSALVLMMLFLVAFTWLIPEAHLVSMAPVNHEEHVILLFPYEDGSFSWSYFFYKLATIQDTGINNQGSQHKVIFEEWLHHKVNTHCQIFWEMSDWSPFTEKQKLESVVPETWLQVTPGPSFSKMIDLDFACRIGLDA